MGIVSGAVYNSGAIGHGGGAGGLTFTFGTGTTNAGAVTVNTTAGKITVGAGDDGLTQFTITNSTVTADSLVFCVTQQSSGAPPGVVVALAAGSFTVVFSGALGVAAKFNFIVINPS